jgi:hypothetical protein
VIDARGLPAPKNAMVHSVRDSARAMTAAGNALASAAAKPAKEAVARKSVLALSVGLSATEQNVVAGAWGRRAQQAAKWTIVVYCARERFVPRTALGFLAAVGALGQSVQKSALAPIAEQGVLAHPVQRVARARIAPQVVQERSAPPTVRVSIAMGILLGVTVPCRMELQTRTTLRAQRLSLGTLAPQCAKMATRRLAQQLGSNSIAKVLLVGGRTMELTAAICRA